eukprot:NODE_2737_length_512_cov_134.303896_g2687_i0.p1 GENE.NODE_2737_length_512_cov_134.303896_g2687_i0~~NODE_2737_length_512_cov_134.303896_g2687_i0.p1  ORF type:complete len:121 (-),score=29.61 NODE_2737_length_512_cov_134.303896_g2687_i0:77-439(-)
MVKGKSAPRLFQPGIVAGFKRSLRTQKMHTAILKVQGVDSMDDAKWYLGKRVCYVFNGKKKVKGIRTTQNPKLKTRKRAIWGKVTTTHGASGGLKAKFSPNVPAHSLGGRVRVYMYPYTN